MPAETALAFLRALAQERPDAPIGGAPKPRQSRDLGRREEIGRLGELGDRHLDSINKR